MFCPRVVAAGVVVAVLCSMGHLGMGFRVVAAGVFVEVLCSTGHLGIQQHANTFPFFSSFISFYRKDMFFQTFYELNLFSGVVFV
jgi:hypothetical protein